MSNCGTDGVECVCSTVDGRDETTANNIIHCVKSM